MNMYNLCCVNASKFNLSQLFIFIYIYIILGEWVKENLAEKLC